MCFGATELLLGHPGEGNKDWQKKVDDLDAAFTKETAKVSATAQKQKGAKTATAGASGAAAGASGAAKPGGGRRLLRTAGAANNEDSDGPPDPNESSLNNELDENTYVQY